MSPRETVFTNVANLCIGGVAALAGPTPTAGLVTGAMALTGLMGLGIRLSERHGLLCAAVRKRVMRTVEKRYQPLTTSREFAFHLDRAKDILGRDLTGCELDMANFADAATEGFPEGARNRLLAQLPFDPDERSGMTHRIVSDALDEGLAACRASPEFMADLSAELILAMAPTLNLVLAEQRDANAKLIRLEAATATTEVAPDRLEAALQDLLPALHGFGDRLDRLSAQIDLVLAADDDTEARQPELETLWRDGVSNYFGARMVPHVGREDELGVLAAFAADTAAIRWLQIAGDAGQGKSRLALEFCIAQQDIGWNAGFLSRGCLSDDGFAWSRWQPYAPTLIVIDYIIGFEADVGRVMAALTRRDDLSHPVRLILIERHRFDQAELRAREMRSAEVAGKSGDQFASESVALGHGEARAEWFTQIVGRYDGRDLFIERASWSPTVLQLRGLTSDDLLLIFRDYSQQKGLNPDLADARILRLLREADLQGRPLFAYILADALDASGVEEHLRFETLLERLMEKDHCTRWAPAFDGRPPTLLDRHPALELAVLATMVGELAVQHVPGLPLSGPADSVTLRQALAINDAPARTGLLGPGPVVSGLEPDLIGEWLVLSFLANHGDAVEALTAPLWAHYPGEVANFLLRAAQDFAGHATLERLFATTPAAGSSPLVGIAASVVKAYADADLLDRTPAAILAPLTEAAEADDARAQTNLGLHYRFGINVEKVPARAAALFQAAADKGNPVGRRWLVWCYLNGYGVEHNVIEAVRYLSLSAADGDASAMEELGDCHFNALSEQLPRDYDEARRWYDNAVTAGQSSAVEKLAVMHQAGLGGARDLDAAERLLAQAVDAGRETAVSRLRMLERARSAEPMAPERVVALYLRAEQAGSAGAMLHLGACHESGYGVAPDPHAARHWYEKAMRFGSKWAARRLIELDEADRADG